MNTSEVVEFAYYLRQGYAVTFFVASLIIMIGSFVIFPFYVYVNKVNRSRDESTPVFPITNHFYEMIKKIYVLILYMVSSAILINLISFSLDVGAVLLIILYLSLLALYIIIQVFYLLLGLLAVQRLLIYFFSSIEKRLSNVIVTLHKYIWYIYIAFCLKEIIGIICFIVCHAKDCKKQKRFDIFYISTFLSMNLFVIISALFYIPITLSVWKLTNLTSLQSKPHRYIFFQTLTILIFKFISIPILIFFGEIPVALAIAIIAGTDILFVPLLIQVSYLGCNKRNINMLFREFKLKTFIKVLLDIKSEVTPQMDTAKRYSNVNV